LIEDYEKKIEMAKGEIEEAKRVTARSNKERGNGDGQRDKLMAELQKL